MSLDHIDSKKAIIAGVGVAAGIGILAATVGHFVCHARAMKSYKKDKLQRQDLRNRKDTLDTSLYICPAESFEEMYKAKDDDTEVVATLELQAGGPGCFAVLAYDADPEEGGYESYEAVYVGGASEMAQGTHRHLSGKGNPYIGADVACGRKLYVAFFPCELYQVYSYRDRLAAALGAYNSYNRFADVEDIQ